MNLQEKIEKALNSFRPTMQTDGGDVEFVNFDEKTGILQVRLLGMCSHCPMSQITIKQGIEVEIKKEVPEVKEVVGV